MSTPNPVTTAKTTKAQSAPITALSIFEGITNKNRGFSAYLYTDEWSKIQSVCKTTFVLFNKGSIRDKQRAKALLKAVLDANPLRVISVLSVPSLPSPTVVKFLNTLSPPTIKTAATDSIGDESIILTKSHGGEEHLSQKTGKIVRRRHWSNVTSLEAATWLGDIFIVLILHNHIPIKLTPIAAQQLQTVLDKGTEHGTFLSPYRTLIEAIKTFHDNYASLYKLNQFNVLKDLLVNNNNKGIGKCQYNLPICGLQELCDEKYFNDKTRFTKPPTRSLLLCKADGGGPFNFDDLGVKFALVKGEWNGASNTASVSSAKDSTSDDAVAFKLLIETRTAEFNTILKFMKENQGKAPHISRSTDKETVELIHKYLDLNQGKNPNGNSIVKLRRFVRKKDKPEMPTKNIYTIKNTKNAKEDILLTLDESVIIFHAKETQKRRFYILKEKLGSGLHGAVKNTGFISDFAALQLQTHKERVIKVVSFGEGTRISKEEAIEMAELEKKLGDSEGYVIREDENKIYIDMPKHPGKDLYYYLDKKTINDFDEKIRIAIAILEQLKRIHDKSYIHCDLKPGNIMYEQQTGKLRIIDMSVSIKGKETTTEEQLKRYGEIWCRPGGMTGTEGYIAPETGKNGEYSEKTDVYAVGILLAVNFSLSDETTLVVTKEEQEKINQDHPALAKMQKLVSNMINVDPNQRIGVADALNELYEIQKLSAETKKTTIRSLFK